MRGRPGAPPSSTCAPSPPPPLPAQATTLEKVDDLEDTASPEDLMLSYVSGDKSKVRAAACVGSPAARVPQIAAQWLAPRVRSPSAAARHCSMYHAVRLGSMYGTWSNAWLLLKDCALSVPGGVSA